MEDMEKNPNRLQHYYQFQVIIKPSPKDIKQLYLKSLMAIGIDSKEHDIRFVEDDWESPTLGAAGLGWEVWCDGNGNYAIYLFSKDDRNRMQTNIRGANIWLRENLYVCTRKEKCI